MLSAARKRRGGSCCAVSARAGHQPRCTACCRRWATHSVSVPARKGGQKPFAFTWDGGRQTRAVLPSACTHFAALCHRRVQNNGPPLRRLAMTKDTAGCHNWGQGRGSGCYQHLWVAVRGAANHPLAGLPHKELSGPKCEQCCMWESLD